MVLADPETEQPPDARPALPFVPPRPDAPPPRPSARFQIGASSLETQGESAVLSAPPPPPSSRPEPVLEPVPSDDPHDRDETTFTELPVPDGASLDASPIFLRDARVDLPPPQAHQPDVPPPSMREPALPPPLIGPLATPEMVLREQQAAVSPDPDPAPAPEPEPEPDAAAPPAPEEPGLPLAKYPLDRCARIAASIARRKPDTAAILEEHELDQPTWKELVTHWQDAIRAESGKGKATLMNAYDDAFVGQLEAERGPIRVEEYARLVVAQERGAEREELEALSLPPSSMMRVGRVWSRRAATNAELAKGLRLAIEEARAA
jgi:hypothetical protein